MQTKYFRVNKNEYCHINDDTIFIISSKEVVRVPPPHELGEGWGIVSILNYLLFVFLLVYVAVSVSGAEANFFKQPLNYAALFLLFLSLIRMKDGFLSSKTPFLDRSKIRSVYFETPKFSYPRLVIYFEGPEGKVLRRTIPVLYTKEALPVLKEMKLV
jgi:hypothetical protein